ncbi:MAG: hypothetical protein MJ252_12850 [archaeon]|nr:hypothetical protein [archaeon]
MESMKDLVIQALETKGVLGQIRARLRSAVFKIVDEQDQQGKFGCGLKWENKKLYRILETKVGQLLSEVMREFMEYYRMDYSLSIFIPECGISPERLKKEDILEKLGVNQDSMDFFQQLQMPLLYYIIFYFMENLKKNPEEVLRSIKKAKTDVEKECDIIIKGNEKENPEDFPNNPEDIPLSDQRGNENIEENIQGEEGPGTVSQLAASSEDKIKGSAVTDSSKKDSIIDIDPSKLKDRSEEKEPKKDEDLFNVDEIEEIEERIIPEDEFERSGDKKNSSSNNTNSISMSGGNDISVDSHKLETYNYVEKAENPNKGSK